MSRVTSKLQVTIPKAIADQYGIEPGVDVTFEPAGDTIRVRIGEEPKSKPAEDAEWRLGLFDQATKRQATRNRRWESPASQDRGWTRDELYDRGLSR